MTSSLPITEASPAPVAVPFTPVDHLNEEVEYIAAVVDYDVTHQLRRVARGYQRHRRSLHGLAGDLNANRWEALP